MGTTAIPSSDIQFEIDCRKLLLKKLEPLKKRLQANVNTEKASCESRKAQLLKEYRTVEEAHEAFGFGDITEDEYRAIAEGIETPNPVSPESAAFELLKDFMIRLKREIKDFEWEALPQAERDRVIQSNEQYKAELQARRVSI